MRFSPFITMIVLVIISWASLFITIIDQAHRLDKVATQNQQLALTTRQLANQNQSIAKEIKAQTDSIHQQANCIFLFFAQPLATRNSSSVTYPPACVTSSSLGGVAESTNPVSNSASKSVTAPSTSSPGQPSPTTPPPGSHNTNTGQGTPKPPVRSLLDRITGGLL